MPNSKLFLFNSSLPEKGLSRSEFLHSLGPSNNNFRGQNIGNGYITYGFLKTLFGAPVKVGHLANAWEGHLDDDLANEINSSYSHLVFIMQDFVREHSAVLPFDRIIKFVEKIKIPIVPLSLGANSFNGYDTNLVYKLSNDQKKFLSMISDKSKVIGVRGEFTADILNRLGIRNVQVVGCPSFFESGPNRSLKIRRWDSDRIITTGSFFNKGIALSKHLLQDELYFINLLYSYENESLFKDENSLSFNELDLQIAFNSFKAAVTGRFNFFSDFKKWEDFYTAGDFCLTIGTRLHSGIFSINRGVPAIVTNGDARARETCDFLKIPHIPDLDLQSDIKKIYDRLDLTKMNSQYSKLYENYQEYLSAHGLYPDLNSDVESRLLFEFPSISKKNDKDIYEEIQIQYMDLISSLTKNYTQLEMDCNKLRHQLSQLSCELDILQNFKLSTAGRIGLVLQKMRIRHPKLADFTISSLKRMNNFYYSVYEKMKKHMARKIVFLYYPLFFFNEGLDIFI